MNGRQNISLGVGDGTGQLFVHGDHASISACQQKLLELERMRAENEALREALEAAIEWDSYDDAGVPAVWLDQARQALAAHDKGVDE